MNLGEEEVRDLWYGKCLRLADEVGCFDQAVKDMAGMTSAEELQEYYYNSLVPREPMFQAIERWDEKCLMEVQL